MTDARLSTPDDAEAAFYSAFAGTDLGAMAQVWHTGDEARCIHPGGDLLIGTGAVLASWRQIFAGAAAPTVRHRVLHRAGTGDLRVHLVEERIGPQDADSDDLTRVLATNVYRRTNDGWRMVLHHATLPLVEPPQDPAEPTSAGGRLH
jgi:ketosteroid isomerase-like protein